jgi:predicted dehydrogenase
MNEVKVAIAGCGRISDLHEMGYRDRDDAAIVAVMDTNKRRARNKAQDWGVEKVYADYEQLLADPEVDMVELLTPHHLHAPMTIAACRAGKHVSVQKPMALTTQEARAMIDAADEAGVLLRVYENFVHYPPFVKAKEMLDAGEIGEPQMIRVHYNSGTRDTGWDVPLNAWIWRFDEDRCGGGPIIFDHGFHLFSIARHLMGEVERVYAWIDRSRIIPTKYVDAPATMMFQFKGDRRYGVMSFAHTPNIRIESTYYSDDNRVEILGDRGILMINRCTARMLELPELMLHRDGKTTQVPVDRVEWHDSFIDCTGHFIDVLRYGGEPSLSGQRGLEVMQFVVAAHISAREGIEVRPDSV